MKRINCNLIDVCTKITDGAHWSPKSVKEGIPMASVKDMTDFGFNIESCRKISEEDYKKLVKNDCKPLKNDILIAKDGSYLKHVFVWKEEKDLAILSSIAILRPNLEKIDSAYLAKYLQSPFVKKSMANYVSGAAIPRIILKDFKQFSISIPKKINEQKNIAIILSNYDGLIENNEKRIKVLENIAKLIYEEWFVRFKFPGHEKVKMIDSETEFGIIPEGWKVKPFSDFCSKITDGTHEVIKPVKDGFYMVSATNLKDGFIDFSRTHFISEKDHKKIMLRSKPEKGDILFSKIGTIGNIAVVKQDFEFSIKNIALFKPLSNELSSFIYSYFNNDSNLANFSTKASGTSQKFFSLAFLRNMNMVYPEEKIILNFDRVVCPILEQRHILNKKNQNLRKTRDLLLPKLISGEIDVTKLDIKLNQEIVNT